jgi:hypothetical protein
MLEDPELYPHLQLKNEFIPPGPTVDGFTPIGAIKSLYASLGWYDHVVRGCGRDTVNSIDPTFFTENNGHNLVLAVCIDAFVPSNEISYSITPFMGMVLNLPENLRHKADHMLLIGVVPGRRLPKNLQTYLAVLVDELIELNRTETAIHYTDPVTKQPAISRVKLLLTCADYPGASDMRCQQGANATYGCMACEIKVRVACFAT